MPTPFSGMTKRQREEWWREYYIAQGWREVAPGWWNPPPLGPRAEWITAKALPVILTLLFLAPLVWAVIEWVM
jgi:hypothetical protein